MHMYRLFYFILTFTTSQKYLTQLKFFISHPKSVIFNETS